MTKITTYSEISKAFKIPGLLHEFTLSFLKLTIDAKFILVASAFLFVITAIALYYFSVVKYVKKDFKKQKDDKKITFHDPFNYNEFKKRRN